VRHSGHSWGQPGWVVGQMLVWVSRAARGGVHLPAGSEAHAGRMSIDVEAVRQGAAEVVLVVGSLAELGEMTAGGWRRIWGCDRRRLLPCCSDWNGLAGSVGPRVAVGR